MLFNMQVLTIPIPVYLSSGAIYKIRTDCIKPLYKYAAVFFLGEKAHCWQPIYVNINGLVSVIDLMYKREIYVHPVFLYAFVALNFSNHLKLLPVLILNMG